MSKKQSSDTTGQSNWYRVKETSFIGEALREEGDYVQFDGKAGANLEPVSEEEVRKAGVIIKEDEELAQEARGTDLDRREKDINAREKELLVRDQEIKDLTKAADARTKQLDEREADLVAREKLLK